MKGLCPECGFHASLSAFLSEAEGREFMALLESLPEPIRKNTLRYLGFFRPEKRGLTWPRALKLLKELQELTNAERIEWDKRPPQPCPPTLWGNALEAILTNPDGVRRPLKSHNFLLAVAYPLAEKAAALGERSKGARPPLSRSTNADRISDDKQRALTNLLAEKLAGKIDKEEWLARQRAILEGAGDG